MNGGRYYGVRIEGAKYGIGFGPALAITISYAANHSILWAIIDGILGWLYVIYFAAFSWLIAEWGSDRSPISGLTRSPLSSVPWWALCARCNKQTVARSALENGISVDR